MNGQDEELARLHASVNPIKSNISPHNFYLRQF